MTANTPPLRTDLPPFATRSTREWQAADAAHFLHPFTDHQALAAKGVRVITRGEPRPARASLTRAAAGAPAPMARSPA